MAALPPKEFIEKYKKAIINSTLDNTLFPSVKMAQAALETGWGKSTIEDGNNLFGVKAGKQITPYWNGATVTAKTKEDYGNGQVSVTDKFRKYATMSDSIKDHSYILTYYSRYKPVLAATTPEEQARQLQKCGYATATSYANSLISIINAYNLKSLDDEKKKYQNAESL